MRVACLGGGPGGLYFAARLMAGEAAREVVVWDRRAPGAAYGFGVVLSEQTQEAIRGADPEVFERIDRRCVRWDDIDVHYRDTVVTSGGHAFAALGREELLEVLRGRCREVGVDLRLGAAAPPLEELRDYDVVVVAEGGGSATRAALAGKLRPRVEVGACRYLWLGSDLKLDSFVFHVLPTPFGVMVVHGYPHATDGSTLVFELHERVWRAAGLDRYATVDDACLRQCEQLLEPVLGGARLRAGTSTWSAFRTVTTERWSSGTVALLGDAAHTAHFSIGSGTKLAMEDAERLAARLREAGPGGVPEALRQYEDDRRPVVESTQRAARASMEWFEHLDQYTGQEPLQFSFNLLTRSRRVTYDNLRQRDPRFVREVTAWFARAEAAAGRTPAALPADDRPPMFLPLRIGPLELPNRVMLSPMAMYSAEDGLIGDFHLVHLGSRALGGAGLVMTEMVAPSAEGRITPGCAGLYRPEHEAAYARLVDFVHRHSEAKVGIQLGHAGPKGSTRPMWEGMDQPLPSGNWPLIGPSAVPYLPGGAVPRVLDRAGMDQVRDQYVAAAQAAARAGFDLLELHCAHGYLLSSFITPLSNRRDDRYGGPLENRLRYPLEVFDAVRAAWPPDRPMTVRISATDWAEGGVTGDEAVAIAEAFGAHGADAIDVSTGQTTSAARPRFGRSWQVPFADRIRNRTGLTTIAVGAISSFDDVNSILVAGRADLCALGRTMLYDPAWPLHAAAEQDYPGVDWPVQFEAGRRRPMGSR